MKTKSIPLDEVHVELFKDSRVADYAVRFALQDFKRDNNIGILLDTLRLVKRAQGGMAENRRARRRSD